MTQRFLEFQAGGLRGLLRVTGAADRLGAPDGERWEIYTVLADSETFWGDDSDPHCC